MTNPLVDSGQRVDVDPQHAGFPADHAVLTRFNVPTPGVESLIRAQDGWLRGRTQLFERYTLPAMKRQVGPGATWLIYFDPESPQWFLEWIEHVNRDETFVAVFRESVSEDDLAADLKTHAPRFSNTLITTNLDNDDGLADDFLLRIQRAVTSEERTAIYLANGLIRREHELYLRHDQYNAFCSVSEPWDGAVTCWSAWHNRLHLQMSTTAVEGPPAWIQVVHGNNVSNRVHGRRVGAVNYRDLFGVGLDGVTSPRRVDLWRDRLLRRPVRLMREHGRSGVKKLIMRAAGTDGLDRLKLIIGRARGRS